jgi:uncharacterized protein
VPECDGAPLGAPCWIDLTSSDIERARDFYGTVFGWTFESQGPSVGGYITASKDGRQVAGMLANVRQWPFPDGWSTYFHTADVDATLSTVVEAGAKVRLGRMQLPARGVMAAATDPTGAAFRLWQPVETAGFEAVGEAGTPVWHQLTTAESGSALDFYRKVFGWRADPPVEAPESSLTTILFDGEPLLAIKRDENPPPKSEQSCWRTFFGASNLDSTLQVIAAAGGTLLKPVDDTPQGRLATATDPTGVTFHIASLNS